MFHPLSTLQLAPCHTKHPLPLSVSFAENSRGNKMEKHKTDGDYSLPGAHVWNVCILQISPCLASCLYSHVLELVRTQIACKGKK
jgi:hypothetical protein